MQKKNVFIVGLFIFFLISPIFLNAGDLFSNVKEINKLVGEYQARIDEVDRDISFLVILALLIPVLGVIASIMEAMNLKRRKRAVIIIGTLISIISLITMFAFEEDFKSLKKKSRVAKMQICEIKLAIINRPLSGDNESEIKEWLNEIFKRVVKLENTLNATKTNDNLLQITPISILHAADQNTDLPQWIVETPQSKNVLFFLGVGEAGSLQDAKRQSVRNASFRATSYFSELFDRKQLYGANKLNLEVLAEYIENSSNIDRTFFKRGANKFIYFTLLKVNKNLVSFHLRFFAVENKNFKFSLSILRAIKEAEQLSYKYQSNEGK